MDIQIWSSTNAVYTLPPAFQIIDMPLERRESTEDIAFGDGGQDLSDGCYKQRIVEMVGDVSGWTSYDFMEELDNLRYYFGQDNFKLVLPEFRRYINVKKCLNFNEVFGRGGMYRFLEDLQIELLCTDPFWYNMAETVYAVPDETKTETADITAAGSGDVYGQRRPWATIHAATAGSTVNKTRCYAGVYVFGGNLEIHRAFMSFNTTTLAKADVVTASIQMGWVNTVNNNDDDGKNYLVLVESLQADKADLDIEDFDQCGDAETNPTELSDHISLNSLNIGDSPTFTLNAAGIALINSGRPTAFGIREGHDVENDEPGATSEVIFDDNSGTTFLARLTVTQTGIETGDTFTITNGGNYITRPVVKITSKDDSNDDITLTNTTDNNDAFAYTDTGFNDTDYVTIDPSDGTVVRTEGAVDTTTIQYFTGRFPRLLPGSNSYSFEGLLSSVQFTFRERFL